MARNYIMSTFAGALMLGLTTAAMAATGEFDNMCTEGLALGKDVKTDCSVNTVSTARPIASAMRKPRRCL
jgi:hypothetical protein